MASSIPHETPSPLRCIDVLTARLRGRVSSPVPHHLQRTFSPSFLRFGDAQLLLGTQTLRFPAVPGLTGNLGRGLSAIKKHSFSIDRARRKHQRLPSSLLIENVPAIRAPAPLRCFAPRHLRSRLTTKQLITDLAERGRKESLEQVPEEIETLRARVSNS